MRVKNNQWPSPHNCPLPLIPSADVYVPMIPGTGLERMIGQRIKAQPNHCWYWDNDSFNYGHLTWNGEKWSAHRLVYCMFHKLGHLPTDMHVHHTCIHPGCVNPDHLVLLTAEQHKAEHKLLRAGCRGTAFGSCDQPATTHGRCLACHRMQDAARRRKRLSHRSESKDPVTPIARQSVDPRERVDCVPRMAAFSVTPSADR